MYSRDTENIKWTRPLHEYITGCKTYSNHLPPHEELSLSSQNHSKTRTTNLFCENFSKGDECKKMIFGE